MNRVLVTRQLRQMRKLTEVGHALTNATSLDELLVLAARYAADLLAADRSVLLVANDDGMLAVRASHGLDPGLAQGLAAEFREPASEIVIARLATVLDTPPGSLVGVPLIVSGAIKGILVVLRREPSSDVEYGEWLLAALADHVAVALETTRLNEIAEFREQLIGIIGHDLRGPLTTILMGAQLLLERDGLGQRETDVARKINRSATVATNLIDQLLDLTRSRLGGGIPLDLAPVDLHDVCQQVIDETRLTHPDRTLVVELDGDLTGAFDADRMYQVLANLVGNAVRHGDPRSPIGLSITGGTSDVLIEVSNRGQPIPAAMLPFIFEAFRKKPSSHPSRTHGLGLGLFIAQQIARAHGGAITATSSESAGTSFRVRLPRVRQGS